MSGRNVMAVLSLMWVGWGCSPVLEPVVEHQREALAAVPLAARLVWVLDNSGSVATPLNEGDPGCATGCWEGAPGCTGCVSRKQLLLDNMGQLAVSDPTVRQGSVVFPTDPTCGAPSAFAVPVPAVAQVDGVQHITADYRGRTSAGGTPTSAALDFVTANVLPEPGVETYVVLVTDGLPNCNAQNLNTCVDPAACRCTLGSSSCGSDPNAPFCALGCLDDLGTIDASRRLEESGARLMIVGVGAELATGAQMLSSLSVSLPRYCATDDDCRPGTTCLGNSVCSERIYLVNEAADFQRPRDHLAAAVRRSQRCTWVLEREVARQDLVVTLEGNPVDGATWTLGPGRRVQFLGASCDALLSGAVEPAFAWRPAPEL